AVPFHVGRVPFNIANASARPAPNTLSGIDVLKGTAWPRIRSRIVLRAPVAAMAELARFSRHGAPCSKSAAMPPMWGAAADVPKNGALNDPAPVIDTPSIAAMSG